MKNSILLQIKNKITFLDKINKFLNWKLIETALKSKIKQTFDATGNPSYPILKMFKVILLQNFFRLSDRDMEFNLFYNILFRKFSGFLYDYKTPSYATICRFRNRLFKLGLDRDLFYLINKALRKNKLINNFGIAIDSSIIPSSRRPRKVIDIKKNNFKILYSKDSDANWFKKNKILYYGFKLHMSVDIYHGFITEGYITPASYSDIGEFLKILNLNYEHLSSNSWVLVDKAYTSKKNREILKLLGLEDGIMYKKTKNKKLSKFIRNLNKMISKFRMSVERGFGTLKTNFSLFRSKYLGIKKSTGQFLLAAIAYNLKKASSLIF